ncbi:hypothetical protein R3P38DRAFT_2823037 [Favolaschia claudopus]|uniref:Uncharacterized protein n=1 Tax=Favolaschia claudopus TaxID=2862362 RepID=A0AAW0EFC7_9AGAR
MTTTPIPTLWNDPHRPPSLVSSSPDNYASDHLFASPSPSSSPLYAPRIHSSPSSPAFPQDDYRLSWDPPVDSKVSYPLPSFRSLFPSDDEHPLTSEYDASEYSEPDAHHDDSFLTESEDEEEENDPFYSNSRVTFTVSAERGRWKSDPLPRHPLLRISARTTSPAPSPVPSLLLRNISEPAPSTTKSPPLVASSSLTDQDPSPSASADPVLSPISLSVSPMVGSVSPLSVVEPLSPLSLPSSLAGDHDVDMDLESFPNNDEIPTPMDSENGLGLFTSPLVAPPPSRATPDAPVLESSALVEVIEMPKSTSSANVETGPEASSFAMDADLAPSEKAALTENALQEGPVPPPPSASRDAEIVSTSRVMKAAKKGGQDKTTDSQRHTDKGKKRASQPPPREEVPKSKKARIAPSSTEKLGSRSKRVEAKTKTTPSREVQSKGKKTRADVRPSTSKTKQRKARPPSPSPSTSSSHPSSFSPVEPPRKPLHDLDPELCGMLIESLATSRASSMAMSTLYKTVMQSYPSLKSRGTEAECLHLVEQVLEGGTMAGGGSGVFGKVQRNGKDESDPPLEAQWFYVPERDHDQERAQLISSMMPRPAKRSETKKYKQYYYRPLEKISRWDAEDEL